MILEPAKTNNREQIVLFLAEETAAENFKDEEDLLAFSHKILAGLQHEHQVSERLSKEYFSKRKGFRREFGITLFPFLTFFVSSAEIFEIDSLNNLKLNKKNFFDIISKPDQAKIGSLCAAWDERLKEQLDGMQNTSAERFVWMYSALIDELLHLPEETVQSRARKQLIKALACAVAPFFSYGGENWEMEAIHSMGRVCGGHAQALMPQKEALYERLKKVRRRRFAEKLSSLLEQEREVFQQNLAQQLSPLYMEVCTNMEKAWETYCQKLTERIERISIYMESLR
jgi:hypothetical protein